MLFNELLERLKPFGVVQVAARADINPDGKKVNRFVQIGYESGKSFPTPTGPTHPFYPPDGDGDFDLDEIEIHAALRRLGIPIDKVDLS